MAATMAAPLLVPSTGESNARTARPAAPALLKVLPPSLGVVFALMAGSLTLPITAYTVLIYRRLNMLPEEANEYFLTEFLFFLLAPLVGWVTDRGGPAVRYTTIVSALALKVLFLAGYGLGWVQSIATLYALGLPLHAAHAIAIATLNGALVARGGGGAGDTSSARTRQAAKLGWQTAGDLVAAVLSLVLAAADAPMELFFWLTAAMNAAAALLASYALSRRAPLALEDPIGCRSSIEPTPQEPTPAVEGVTAATNDASDASPSAPPPPVPSACAATAASPSAPPSTGRAAFGAMICALAVGIFMLPPTSDVVAGSYVGRRDAVAQWVLSARQLSAMGGGLLGVACIAKLDLPLRHAVPVGAAAIGAAELSSLSLYALGGNSNSTALDSTAGGLATLLLQPALSQGLGKWGVLPILALGAAAAEGIGEGAAFGLVSAADAAGGIAAGSISTFVTHTLRLGNPPVASWTSFPGFVVICAIAKLAAAPCVLLMLKLRERVMRNPTEVVPRPSPEPS